MARIAAGVVGVIGDATGQGGTGHVVAENLVLTARHTLAPAGGAAGNAKLYPWLPGRENHLAEIPATLVWAPAGPSPDAALLRVAPASPHTLLPDRAIRFGQCAEEPVRARAMGFPRLDRDVVRFDDKLENFPGNAFKATQQSAGGAWTITFGSDRELAGEPEGWKGLSGAALFCGELLVGVFQQFPTAFNARRELFVEPVATLLADAAVGPMLGIGRDAVLQLARPEPPPQPAPLPGKPPLSDLAAMLFSLDRTDEADLAQNAMDVVGGAAPLELLVSGRPDDLHEEFVRRLAEDAWHQAMPARISWPGGANLRQFPDLTLARNAAAALGEERAAGIAQLRAILAKQPLPPWLWLDLPGRLLDDLEAGLLARFRAGLAGLSRADGRPFGWVLSWCGAGPVPDALKLPQSADMPPLSGDAGLRQIEVPLSAFPRSALTIWPTELDRRARARKLADAASWPLLARDAAALLPAPYEPVRLLYMRELLEGRALPPLAATAAAQPPRAAWES